MQDHKRINVTRSSMPAIEDFIEEIRPIFDSHILTNMGPLYKKFQHQLMDYLDVPELSLFVNGHMALELAIDAFGMKKRGEEVGGGEVITTPFTFVSTSHAIIRNNLKPVFCDIDPNTYTLDPTKIEALITEKTVGIVPVHVYGYICDVEAINEIAKKYQLPVIYDAAHAFGVTYKGKGIGNYGSASMFSFHATKVFNSIEGGAIVFKDEKYKEILHEIKNFGIHGADNINSIGANAKLDEIRAAMGLCNLRRMDECISARKSATEHYFERLEGTMGLRLPTQQKDVSANYAYFPVYLDKFKFGKSRDDVFERLKANNIYARKYFVPSLNEAKCYRHMKCEPTPVSHDVSNNIITLPMFEELTISDVDRICDIILG